MTANLLAGLPPEHTRFVQLPNDKGHNAAWDFRRSPDGRFYVSVCGESDLPLSALLYEYDPRSGGLSLILDVEKSWIVDPRQMPPSKIHTSLDFLSDGRLIMATHNTSPAPGHQQWLFEQHYEHPWEGYPGSVVLIVDPDTRRSRTLGIPVPRESIYGGILGDDQRYYYFLGYMRGHFYRLNLETNEVKDYGKVSEFASCRLIKDGKGRIYGSAYTGELWRYDPGKDEIEDLKVCFRSPHGTKYRRALIFGLNSPRGTLFLTNNVDGEMLELHPETLEVTRHGSVHLRPEQPRNPYLRHAIGGLAADKDFVLYYGLETYHGADLMRLVRWDILRGGEPENLGLIAPDGKQSHYVCEMEFDCDGWLHLVDVCGAYSPYILAVDVARLSAPGEEAPAADIRAIAEPDMHMNADDDAFMHIEAESTRTLPLHRHMRWKDTAVGYMRLSGGKLYGITGGERVCRIICGSDGDMPEKVETLYEGGGFLSGADLADGLTAVLTTDGRLLLLDPVVGEAVKVDLPGDLTGGRLHFALEGRAIAASDRDGFVYELNCGTGTASRLDGIRLHTSDAHLQRLDERYWLLSGTGTRLLKYDRTTGRAEKLGVAAPSIRGRGFAATLTGGALLTDGTFVGGTRDGMLFALTPDLRRSTGYGRLYSAGALRNFVLAGDDVVLGVYGGSADAGHVFRFSPAGGFADLGRPRVVKDNAGQREVDSEWANIHHISLIAYSPQEDCLWVASTEQYGCAIRYRGLARSDS
ncbi:hypothetical protein [Cohnella sp.]|uniref:hypothetical protein n=1 Tax=Cohnella sp. TaxID=1883426 RepID=UPI003703B95E